MGRHPGLSWAQRLVRGVDVIQFPWKTSAEPTRRRVSWDCRGSGPHPWLLSRLVAKGEGLPERPAVPPDPAEPEGDAAPGTLHSQKLTASAGAVAGGSQRTTASLSRPKPNHSSLRDKLSGFSSLERVQPPGSGNHGPTLGRAEKVGEQELGGQGGGSPRKPRCQPSACGPRQGLA